MQVTNYPMMARPALEEELFQQIERIRAIEIAEIKVINSKAYKFSLLAVISTFYLYFVNG